MDSDQATVVSASAVVQTSAPVTAVDPHVLELDHLLASVRSDFKGSINQILHHSRTIIEQPTSSLSNETRHHITKILETAGLLKDLIDEVTHATQICRAELDEKEQDIALLARAAVEELVQKHPGFRLQVRIPNSMNAIFDSRLMNLFLIHALHNAERFTQGVPQPQSEITLTEKEGKFMLLIRDNGPGFSPHHAARMFETVERQNIDRDHPGAGMSLAILKQIAMRQNWKIWAMSQPGRGCTIAVGMTH